MKGVNLMKRTCKLILIITLTLCCTACSSNKNSYKENLVESVIEQESQGNEQNNIIRYNVSDKEVEISFQLYNVKIKNTNNKKEIYAPNLIQYNGEEPIISYSLALQENTVPDDIKVQWNKTQKLENTTVSVIQSEKDTNNRKNVLFVSEGQWKACSWTEEKYGVKILQVRIYPISYNSSSRRITYCSSGKVTISLISEPWKNIIDKNKRDELKLLVDNPDMIDQYD